MAMKNNVNEHNQWTWTAGKFFIINGYLFFVHKFGALENFSVFYYYIIIWMTENWWQKKKYCSFVTKYLRCIYNFAVKYHPYDIYINWEWKICFKRHESHGHIRKVEVGIPKLKVNNSYPTKRKVTKTCLKDKLKMKDRFQKS